MWLQFMGCCMNWVWIVQITSTFKCTRGGGDEERERDGEILLQSYPSWVFPAAYFSIEQDKHQNPSCHLFTMQFFSLDQTFQGKKSYLVFIFAKTQPEISVFQRSLYEILGILCADVLIWFNILTVTLNMLSFDAKNPFEMVLISSKGG